MATNKRSNRIIFILCIIIAIQTIYFLSRDDITKDNQEWTEIAESGQQDLAVEQQEKGGVEDEDQSISYIKVHIAGQVNNPGVIALEPGARVEDAINMAGGLTPQGDITHINLAAILQDQDKVYIPSTEEVEAHPDAFEAVQGSGMKAGGSGLVNINRASAQELEQLPGIGPVKAQSIIEYRDKNGYFTKIDDIINVSGIGEKTFERIKDSITI
jgi:competence protein ComEA